MVKKLEQTAAGRWRSVTCLGSIHHCRTFDTEDEAKEFIDYCNHLRELYKSKEISRRKATDILEEKYPSNRCTKTKNKVRAAKPLYLERLFDKIKADEDVLNKFRKIYNGLGEMLIGQISEERINSMTINAALDHNKDFRPIWAQLVDLIKEMK